MVHSILGSGTECMHERPKKRDGNLQAPGIGLPSAHQACSHTNHAKIGGHETMKSILLGLGILIGLLYPLLINAQSTPKQPVAGELEALLQSGDFEEFRMRYSGFDCLVAFFDSLAVLSPLSGRKTIPVWSSRYTFMPMNSILYGEPQKVRQYCSLWMRGLFWIYLSANHKHIRGAEDGRLQSSIYAGKSVDPYPVYDLENSFTDWHKSIENTWTVYNEVAGPLDQLYRKAINNSRNLWTLAHELKTGLAANHLAWNVENATIYNAVTPMFRN